MHIKTKEFSVTKGELFKIVLGSHFRKGWWVFIIFLILPSSYISKIIFYIAAPIYLITCSWLYVTSSKNKIFYKKQTFEIEDRYLINTFAGENFEKIKLENIIKVIKRHSYYLLYVSSHNYHFIPMDAFFSEEDKRNFEIILKNNNIPIKVQRI